MDAPFATRGVVHAKERVVTNPHRHGIEGQVLDTGGHLQATIRQAVDIAAQAVEDWVFSGMRYVMDRYNRGADEPEKQCGQ